ncbi:MAG: prepilin-type N-terminal cleavage/methylation domain-containing protein [Pedosphaera sp.]|nr:prepilin-type N-terminal cleavage/methylation domain-containing protein [Pedosphaera sp.]
MVLRNNRAGFTLIEIMTVMGIIGMLATMSLPNLIRARSTSQTRVCITNLNKIESAKQVWGLEHARSLDAVPTVTDLIGSDAYIKKMPACPASGAYDFQAVKTPATCTIAGHTL